MSKYESMHVPGLESESNTGNEFTALMLGDGVKPLQTEVRVSTRERLRRGELDQLAERRKQAEGLDSRFKLEPEQLLNPADPVAWKRDGVQEGVYRNLRLGKYSADARLDLLNRSLAESVEEVPSFVKQCHKLGLRTVVINHGRGKHANSTQNILKSCLVLWLPKIDEVLAFHSTQPQHGGVAAIYLLLRKNEQQRVENIERHR